MSATPWITNQLIRMADGRSAMKLEVQRYNPRPAGVIREGGATDAVLTFLQKHPRRFFCFHEIKMATGKTKPAIDWALIYLKSLGMLECVSDEARNPLYLRYRAVVV